MLLNRMLFYQTEQFPAGERQRRVDERKVNKGVRVPSLPQGARDNDEVYMGNELYRFYNGTWYKITWQAVT